MKKLAVVPLLSFWVAAAPTVLAQQSYTFEEACRMGGWEDGPCAPKSQQEEFIDCIPTVGHAFHAEKSSGNDCLKTYLSPSIDAELLVELIGMPNISRLTS